MTKKICDNCSDCNICDLDKNKICNSCGKCIEVENEYLEIKVEGILDEETEYDEYVYQEDLNDEAQENLDYEIEKIDEESDDRVEELYIEDIPELREKYYNDLKKIFKI